MAYLLGFDIGGTKCAVVLGRESLRRPVILGRETFATADHRTPARVLAALVRTSTALLSQHGLTWAEIAAVGVSCGGPLDSTRGLVLGPPNLPGWTRVPVCREIKRRMGVPVRLQNDANACALAEWRWGAARGTRNAAFLTFGTGLGAGLILDGRLYAGTNDLAGEVGHWRLREQGPAGYGKAGSFEGFCSGGGISRADARGRPAHEVFAAARKGEAAARRVVEQAARELGRGLALLVDVLNPEVIVIGSIFARQQRLLWPVARRELEREALPLARKVCRVVPAKLGDRIGDYAALAVAASALVKM
jgi:glucokinase